MTVTGVNMLTNKRIFILGQPGAGKGLLARTLADKLNWEFIDADLGLEYSIGRSLTEIIGQQGADAYYQCQYDILQSQLEKSSIVVATDANISGGVACRKALANEFVIHLSVSTPVQISRFSAQTKPLLPSTDLKQLLDHLHKQRDGMYEQIAQYTLSSDDNELDEHVQSIIEIISLDNDNDIRTKKKPLSHSEVIFLHKNDHSPVRLSSRQAMCLKLMADGFSDKKIATKMHLSSRTVEDHIANIKKSLGCRTSKELIALYYK
jgi:shikimate kinase